MDPWEEQRLCRQADLVPWQGPLLGLCLPGQVTSELGSFLICNNGSW